MAEAIFIDLLRRKGISEQFCVDSAGTAAYHIGQDPDPRFPHIYDNNDAVDNSYSSVSCCKMHNIPVKHKGRMLSKDDFLKFDYILCMDKSNLRDIKAMKPQNSIASIHLFGEFDPDGEKIIQDPYYGGSEGFEHNFQQCLRASTGFLKYIGIN